MKNDLGFCTGDDLAELFHRGLCTMAFQPIMEFRSGKTHGFEALLRGSNGTPLPRPDSLFNQPGELSQEVLLRLDTACVGSALRSGRELARRCSLFINVHSSTLRYLSLNLDSFVDLLNELDIPPHNIVFEISEKTDPRCVAELEKYLFRFVEIGIQVAIDDIGGSFNWIHNMLAIKPSYLKVDKRYIDHIDLSRGRHALVKGLNSMSMALGVDLIAEGIEREGQAKVLNDIGVNLAQGFWLGRPQEAAAWL